MKLSPYSKMLQQVHLLPTTAAFPCAPSNTPHSITVLLRKKEIGHLVPNTGEAIGSFSDEFREILSRTSVSDWSSAPQLLHCQTPQGKAGRPQIPAGKRNPPPGTCSQLTAAAVVSREICPSTASTNLCTFAGVTNLLQMTSGKAKALP